MSEQTIKESAESRDQDFCEEVAIEFATYFNPIYLKPMVEECQCDDGITVFDLQLAVYDHNPNTAVVFVLNSPYRVYIDAIEKGVVGVTLGSGMGNVVDVKAEIQRCLEGCT